MSVLDPTEYVIRTRWDVSGGVPSLNGIQQHVSRIDSMMSGWGRSLTAAFASAAGAVGIGAMVRGVVSLNTEVQNAEYGIASLFSSLGNMQFADALGVARSQVIGLREDAAKGAGDLQDYLNGFQMILGPAGAAGATVEQIRELNKLTLAAGFALRGQEGLRLAPLDIVQALTSGVNERVTPFAIQALRSQGISDSQFNGADRAERMEMLMRGFGTFAGAAAAMGESWDARMATFGDHIKSVARQVSQPLFERWNEQLGRANAWLESHREILTDMADNIGQRLVGVYDKMNANAGGLGIAGVGAAGAAVGGRSGLAMLGASGPGALIAGLGAAVFGLAAAAFANALVYFPDLRRRVGMHLGQLVDVFWDFVGVIGRLFSNPFFGLAGQVFVQFGDALLQTGIVFGRFVIAMTEQLDLLLKMMNAGAMATRAQLSGDTAGRNLWLGRASDYSRAGEILLEKRMGDLLTGEIFKPGSKRDKGEPPETAKPPVFSFAPGSITIKVEAERLDDPFVVASTFDTAMRRIASYPRSSARGYLAPKGR